ncbi:MAG: hypothetical protein IMF09_08950 [Proteobacteria bacterium]|nr:hypothetical protein [Pseudomonadota bacterium]
MRKVSLNLKNGALQSALFFFVLLMLLSCSTTTRELFFDIPPPKPEAEVPEAVETTATEASPVTTGGSFGLAAPWTALNPPGADAEPLPIEETLDWEAAQEFLPKDYKKKPDWSAAIKEGVIRPRVGADPMLQLSKIFQYDFIMPAEKPKNEAYFPHSAHTEWLSCKNCHITVYPYQRNPATMKEMKKGASCGTCHGKNNVAFSLKQCKRCHLNR